MRWTLGLQGAPRRVNHAATAVDDCIYSFGGYCTGEDYRFQRPIDVHQLDTNSLTWKLVRYQLSETDKTSVPFQRYGHTVVSYNGFIILWGGRNDEGACNVVYIYDVHEKKWIKPQVGGTKPGSRDGHSATIVNSAMYIFGGFEDDSERFSQDIYRLNLRTMVWTHVLTHGNPPKWRDFHSASCIEDRLYIFGGRSDRGGPFHTRNEEYDNKLVYFDVTKSSWHEVQTVNPPLGRRSHSSFVFQNKLYIFGGYNGLEDQHFNDIHVFDSLATRWIKLDIPGSPRPCPRRRQSCVLVGDKLYLFGGTSPIPENESQESGFFYFNGVDNRLKDQADLYVLDFKPTLRTLCLLAVNEQQKHGNEIETLPKTLQADLQLFKEPVSVLRTLPSNG
ncbi:Kelch domain-containing protein 3 [Halotydeus destructor]|nr:Kelch domain-containing protein 3 [Halotydeus destructor]